MFLTLGSHDRFRVGNAPIMPGDPPDRVQYKIFAIAAEAIAHKQAMLACIGREGISNGALTNAMVSLSPAKMTSAAESHRGHFADGSYGTPVILDIKRPLLWGTMAPSKVNDPAWRVEGEGL